MKPKTCKASQGNARRDTFRGVMTSGEAGGRRGVASRESGAGPLGSPEEGRGRIFPQGQKLAHPPRRPARGSSEPSSRGQGSALPATDDWRFFRAFLASRPTLTLGERVGKAEVPSMFHGACGLRLAASWETSPVLPGPSGEPRAGSAQGNSPSCPTACTPRRWHSERTRSLGRCPPCP